MKITTKSFAGEAGAEVELNDEVFGLEPRADILHRVVTWQLEKRRGTARPTRGPRGCATPWIASGRCISSPSTS